VERSWQAQHEAGEELDAARTLLTAERMEAAAARAQLATLQAQLDSLKGEVARRWAESVTDDAALFSPAPRPARHVEALAATDD
jgi:hypothetical protein